jgi:hypothetical protein
MQVFLDAEVLVAIQGPNQRNDILGRVQLPSIHYIPNTELLGPKNSVKSFSCGSLNLSGAADSGNRYGLINMYLHWTCVPQVKNTSQAEYGCTVSSTVGSGF